MRSPTHSHYVLSACGHSNTGFGEDCSIYSTVTCHLLIVIFPSCHSHSHSPVNIGHRNNTHNFYFLPNCYWSNVGSKSEKFLRVEIIHCLAATFQINGMCGISCQTSDIGETTKKKTTTTSSLPAAFPFRLVPHPGFQWKGIRIREL